MLSSVAINCPDAATLAAEQCLVFADPAGHPFCLSTWDELQH